MSKTARATLEAGGMGRLFQIFEDDAAAVKSFQRLPVLTIPQPAVSAFPAVAEVYDSAALGASENAA